MQSLCSIRSKVGESPLWSVAEQALYWVDIDGRYLHRFDWATRAAATWAMPERIACVALHAAGGLVAGMETGLFHLHFDATGQCHPERFVAANFPATEMRFNDGRCDREGRFWVTSMVRDTALASAMGALYRYDQRGLSEPLVQGLLTGNGIAFSPDGRRMYLSDSHALSRMVWAFDLDLDGVPSNRRLFTELRGGLGRPDGAAIDVEGGYWICGNDAGLVHRFLPNGHLDRSIRLPVSKPSMCSFGGPEMAHLFITSIQPAQPVVGFDAALDGAVFVTQPGIKGVPETPFKP
jgi:sugar lactone lactonase YvrE